MSMKWLLYPALIALSIALPLVFPNYTQQFSTLWVLIVLALTWDMQGGQMGYNSLGNIFFFGLGMYVSAVVQIGIVRRCWRLHRRRRHARLRLHARPVLHRAGHRADCWRALSARSRPSRSAGCSSACAGRISPSARWASPSRRPRCSAPGTGSAPARASRCRASRATRTRRSWSFYAMFMVTGIICFAVIAWLYSTRFGLALNAIRDDEQKAEGMGLPTLRIKQVSWAIVAFFVGIVGRDLRQQYRLHRAARRRLPDDLSRHLHGRRGAARRQGHALGAGHRRDRLPHLQGGHLDAVPRLAVRGARNADRRRHRLLPGGHRRLAGAPASRNGSAGVSRRRTTVGPTTGASNPPRTTAQGAPA